jgi:hypothetical protein
MSAKCFTYWALYLNAAVSQFAIIIGKKQTTHHAFYYTRKQMQKLSIDIETTYKQLSYHDLNIVYGYENQNQCPVAFPSQRQRSTSAISS